MRHAISHPSWWIRLRLYLYLSEHRLRKFIKFYVYLNAIINIYIYICGANKTYILRKITLDVISVMITSNIEANAKKIVI